MNTPIPAPDVEVHTTSSQLDALQHHAYCQGGTEVLQELLQATLGQRDANEEKAAIAQEIWDDVYGGAKSMSAGSIKLAEAIAVYRARAATHLEVSDMVEVLLGHLVASGARPLSV